MDEVSLELMHKVMRQTEAISARPTRSSRKTRFGQNGRRTQKAWPQERQGFYDYAADGSKRVWPNSPIFSAC